MVSFNVLGCCVSRDSLTPLIERGGVQVLRYTAFSNPLSMCSKSGEVKISADDLKEYKKSSSFGKRCTVLDINKEVFNYVFGQKSDYIVIDILDARMNLLKKNDFILTLNGVVRKDRELFNANYGFDEYEEISPYDFGDAEWENAICALCEQLTTHYTPNRIILNKFFGVDKYAGKNWLHSFPAVRLDGIKMYNPLCEKLDKMLEEKLKGCHVIEFPKNTIAMEGHRWGLWPLHYHDLYYEYSSKAIEIIMKDLRDDLEKEQLAELKSTYEEKIDHVRTKLELNQKRDQHKWSINALNFSKSVNFDLLGEGNFTRNIGQIKSKAAKVSILKSTDAAAQILKAALKRYEIPIVFETPKFDLTALTDEEWESCRSADLIISANVHSSATTSRDGTEAVLITDLLKSD